MEEIVGMFSLDRAGKSGAIFDEDKLKWLNAIYIRNCDIDEPRNCSSHRLKKPDTTSI